MTFDVLDEHEKGEVVRKWLRDNALAIISGIGIAVVLIFGWQQWKVRQANQAVEAAGQFHAFSEALSEQRDDDARVLARALREDHSGNVYAVFAAMQVADLAARDNRLEETVEQLQWALKQTSEPALKGLVALRLAQAELAQGDAESALRRLDSIPRNAYKGMESMLRGDALHALGRDDEARRAYADSLADLEDQPAAQAVVQMKLDDLGAGMAVEPAP